MIGGVHLMTMLFTVRLEMFTVGLEIFNDNKGIMMHDLTINTVNIQ